MQKYGRNFARQKTKKTDYFISPLNYYNRSIPIKSVRDYPLKLATEVIGKEITNVHHR